MRSTTAPKSPSKGFRFVIAVLLSLSVVRAATNTFILTATNAPVLAKPVQFIPIHDATMKFTLPTWAVAHPELPGGWLVLEQHSGKLWLLEREGGTPRKAVFADLSDGTRFEPWEGFLCAVFHPQFTKNRRYFVKRDVIKGTQRSTIIVERLAKPDGRSDAGRESRLILEVPAFSENHHGGTLAFGADGMLYVGMGDGGPQEDPEGHAQEGRQLLGKFLRLDVDRPARGRAYGIPADNPFVANSKSGIRPEVWALGFREPWRFSFDRQTGELWVGDVGQLRFEEISVVRRGENHGWNVFEAAVPFSEKRRRTGENYVFPVLAYGRELGVSVTGGYVYRGRETPSFGGVYVFGDYVLRTVWGLRRLAAGQVEVRKLGVAPEPLVSFAEDLSGELHVVGQNGTICRLDFTGSEWK